MSSVCPAQCNGLASAALFIAGGVVQLLSGIILMRSKYVYLLSGPDFWTAATNITIGCLMGLASSVWKFPKRKTRKYVARRNLLAALLVSSVVINVTTCTILILGEGNALLSIHFARNAKHGIATFASEVIGYAYAASVLTPIVCSGVSTIALLSECCPQRPYETPVKTPKSHSRKKLSDDMYDWVFTPPNAAGASRSSIGNQTQRSTLTVNSLGIFNRERCNPLASPITFASPSIMRPESKSDLRHSWSAPDFRNAITSPFMQSPNTSSSASISPTADIVPIRVGWKIPRPIPRRAIPVRSPVVPKMSQGNQAKIETSCSTSTHPKMLDESVQSSVARWQQDYEKERKMFSSGYQKVDGRKLHRNRARLQDISPMESIDEITADEASSSFTAHSPANTSGYCSPQETTANDAICINGAYAVDYNRYCKGKV